MRREITSLDFETTGIVLDPVTQVELTIPAFSNADSTVVREAKRGSGELRRVRFFPDHGHRWPLWDSSVGYTAGPEDFGLSGELTQALRHWCDEWELAVGAGEPWKDPVAQRAWEERGDLLALRLAEEVWDFAIVHAEHRD
ncbi:hypothetical protein [Leifsonia shinshuensis]|uniref:Uncharacterized protein n=1 Tax=Leifsonia shinshuensis TaxID=150026 RepID=A0A853D1H1_9MICO|nr:hypothetical protein [Leifsonia shinshuensis]NYJ24870.1 hypothetical protein [Leifsonia shinshuensis]